MVIRTSPTPTTVAAFLAIVLLGGGNGVAVRFSNQELAPFWGATLRFGIASIALLAIVGLRTGARTRPDTDRVLATVMFTDIVGSTERAAGLADAAWADLLQAHHARVRDQLARYAGREIGTTGNGFLAIFDGPARGVRCALAVADALRPLGLEVRAGLHTGEIELAGDDIRGLAIHIGARIAALAGAGEVLVSRTVRDLVVGSGLTFRDRGTHVLKGVPDEWQLFAAEAT